MARLESWFMRWLGDVYQPPEQRDKTVVGLVYGSTKFRDGDQIRLGRLTKSEGRSVTTKEGDVFELGEPEASYLAWLKEVGIPFDEVNPVKLVDEYQYLDEGP